MDAAVVSDVFQNSMHRSDDAALASNIFWCARIAGGIFDGDHNRVADFEFAAGGFHDCSQSGRTLGASAVAPNLSASLCCAGSMAHPAPIKLSTVTSFANSSSDIPSVPAGSCGRTK